MAGPILIWRSTILHRRCPSTQLPVAHSLASRLFCPNDDNEISSSTAFHTSSTFGAIQRIESPNVITVPFTMRRTLEKIKEKEAADDALRRYRRNKGPLIISSEAKETNHFQNRRYAEFNPALHLASWGWKNNQSHGKKINIVAHASHPSFAFEAADAKEKIRKAPREFDALGLDAEFLDAVGRMGFRAPTIVQSLAIPKLLKGANALCASETGSGKTLAYLLPLLQNIVRFAKKYDFRPKRNSPRILIAVPSKELVHQTAGFVTDLTRVGQLPHDFAVVSLLPDEGGISIARQLKTERDVDVVVGTPQLLANLIRLGRLKTNCVQAVVLDEADTLLDDSFVNATIDVLGSVKLRGVDASRNIDRKEKWLRDVVGDEIINEASRGHEANDPLEAVVDHAQLVLVGATLPLDFQRTLRHVVDTDSLHRVTTPHLHRVSQHVHHKFFRVKPSVKPEYLVQLLKNDWVAKKHPPTMIFCNKNSTIRFLDGYLKTQQSGFDGATFEALSKDVEEEERLAVLNRFHGGYTPLLLCSDLASRGIDTSKAVNVINYEFPNNVSDYIHRAGRVGRVGAHHRRRLPTVYSLVSHKWEVDVLWKLERSVRMAEILPDVDANINKRHSERHEEKSVTQLEEDRETEKEEVNVGSSRRVGKTPRGRNAQRRPGLPGSRKLKNIPEHSYEF